MVERIFGVFKRRFRILLLAPEYELDIQNRIPAALCTLHNFIRTHDPDDKTEFEIGADIVDEDVHEPFIDPEAGPEEEREESGQIQAKALRNRIANELWAQYQGVLRDREGDSDYDDDMEDGGSEASGKREFPFTSFRSFFSYH